MREIKFKAYLSVGYVGCDREEELSIEVEDDATENEINYAKEEVSLEWAYNYIDVSFD